MSIIPWIGFLAGTLVTVSSLPKLAERVKRMVKGGAGFSPPDLYRDSLQGFGNGLWVCFGLASGALPVTIFCGLSFVFLATLVLLNLRSRSRSRG